MVVLLQLHSPSSATGQSKQGSAAAPEHRKTTKIGEHQFVANY